ncbi:MAG: exopolysaccharide biosynthesis protein [Fimbriimonadaceae bacterium]|nr:exopolysaccharide biosynthesis protein [Fimbriimonadaceae bacterium]QYK59224.1 MAG: exopolysaccharide biosynthesis protein [Fimbriimonadaceae bacterium]
MRLSENIAHVFLADEEELTVQQVLERSEHRGFGFLLVILSLPVAIPFTPPGVSVPFGVLIGLLAFQMMGRRSQPWFPSWVMRRKVKTGDSRFVRMMKKWAEFFERYLKPRATWVYSDTFFRWFLGPVVLLAAATIIVPLPGTNSVCSFAVLLIALGLLEEDGVFGLTGAIISLIGVVVAATLVTMIVIYGPEGIKMVESWIGR